MSSQEVKQVKHKEVVPVQRAMDDMTLENQLSVKNSSKGDRTAVSTTSREGRRD